MLDLTSAKGRIIDATLRLAARKSWSQITLADIAREANATLLELKQSFTTKADILCAFSAAVDEEVLRRASAKPTSEESARDRLFDVIMTRFDVLEPYRAGIKGILADGPPALSIPVIRQALCSPHWMLAAAGSSSEGPEGAIRTLGLASVYARAKREWLNEEDPGRSRTMAVLDRRLRNGERWMGFLEDACGRAHRLASVFAPGRRRRAAATGDTERHDPQTESGASPAAPPA
jgi:ubiquinone biosynthesis protein COQ9